MSKEVTGTERYAAEVTRQLLAQSDVEIELRVPRDAIIPSWATDAVIVRSRFTGMWFEQVALPLATARVHLLNLSGPAPLIRRNQSVVLFDASVFRYPQTFSPLFVLWYSLLYWVLSRTARHVFTISEFSACEIAEAVHIPRSRLIVAPCGAEHALRGLAQRPQFDVPDNYVLCIGTLAARKNLLPTARELDAAGTNVVVVGAAGKSQVFGAAAGFSELPDNVLVAGRLTDEEVYWLLDHATALVFPSFYEGFGLPVIEAQVRGCPVICADRSSLPEVTGDSALLFDPDLPRIAAGLLESLATSPTLRGTVIENGRRNAARYSWRETARIFADVVVR